MKTLIVGCGEVGDALGKVLADYKPVFHDLEKGLKAEGLFDILHICFPCNDRGDFIQQILTYKRVYDPSWVIIHSTVSVGTSRACGALHSPIRGKHPHLEEGIRTFPKMIGGHGASEVADYFRRAGLRVELYDNQETTEAAKLFDTEYYRACIEFCQRVKNYCDKNNLNFHEVYTLPNLSYNEAYRELGYPEFVRPVLQPIMGKIGGHCIGNNAELIKLSEND